MHVVFTDTPVSNQGEAWAVPVFEGKDLRGAGNPAMHWQLADSLAVEPRFSGKTGEMLTVPVGGTIKSRVVFIGMGKPEAVTPLSCEAAGSALSRAMLNHKMETATLLLTRHPDVSMPATQMAAHVAQGADLKIYTFDRYKTQSPACTRTLTIQMADAVTAKTVYEPMEAINRGVYFARDLTNEPPNELYPAAMARTIVDEFKGLNIGVRVLNASDMEQEKMGALLAVGKGSSQSPMMVIMDYNGLGINPGRPLALIGKGITFDTGGYSIKPAANMDAMKCDMGGAAAVIGAMRTLAERGARAHVIGAVGLAENMVSGDAYRPGDIIRSMSGKTIEINNTDAEGRLVLADVMTYVQRKYNPETMIDLATLTGACRVALGTAYAGLFSNSDRLAARILDAGHEVEEAAWRMPLHPIYNAAMKDSRYADLVNASSIGGSASTAAEFLKEFVEQGVEWAHLDIAAMVSGAKDHPTRPDGIGNGYGVRLLDRLIADHFEAKPQPGPAPSP